MNDQIKKTLVGFSLFVLLGLWLVIAHSTSLKEQKKDDFVLYADFSKTDGLNIGAPVRLAGIPIGHIFALNLSEGFLVRVTLSFDRPITLPLDTSAVIETDGIFGTKHIELVPGGDETNLVSGDVLAYSQDVLLLDELLEKFLSYMRQKKDNSVKSSKVLDPETIIYSESLYNQEDV